MITVCRDILQPVTADVLSKLWALKSKSCNRFQVQKETSTSFPLITGTPIRLKIL